MISILFWISFFGIAIATYRGKSIFWAIAFAIVLSLISVAVVYSDFIASFPHEEAIDRLAGRVASAFLFMGIAYLLGRVCRAFRGKRHAEPASED